MVTPSNRRYRHCPCFDGYAGLRIGKRYTGVPQEDGTLLVSGVGTPAGSGVPLTAEQWRLWFEK